MQSESISEEEYETQFFGFSPSDTIIGIRHLIQEYFEETLNRLEFRLKNIPSKVLPVNELNGGMLELRQSTKLSNEKSLIALENHVLNNIVKIPALVLLPEDGEQATRHDKEEEDALQEGIKQMKTELLNEKYLCAKLKEELKLINLVLDEQHMYLDNSKIFGNDIEQSKEEVSFLKNNVQLVKFEELSVFSNLKEAFERELLS